MKRRLIPLFVFLFTIASGVSNASEATGGDAKLESLLREAAENSPALKTAFERWQAAASRLPQAKSLPDPEVSYGYFVQQMNTRQVFSVSQMFPWFGTLSARESAAAEAAHAAAHRLEAEAVRVFFEVKVAYADFAFLARVVDLAREELDLVRGMTRIARQRFVAGDGGQTEVLRLSMDMNTVENNLATSIDRKRPAQARLNTLVGRAADTAMGTPSLPALDGFSPPDPEEMRRLLEEHPELAARERDIAAAESARRVAGLENRPDFMVGAEHMDGTGMGRDETMLMFSVNLPVWRERNRARIRESSARAEEARHAREAFRLQLESDAEDALFRISDAEREVILLRDQLLPQARHTLQLAESGYRTGNGDFLDLLRTRRDILSLELAYEGAMADYFRSVSRWEMLIAQDAARFTSDRSANRFLHGK